MHFQDKAFRHHDDAFSSRNVGEHEVFAIASRKENVIFLSLPKRSKQTVCITTVEVTCIPLMRPCRNRFAWRHGNQTGGKKTKTTFLREMHSVFMQNFVRFQYGRLIRDWKKLYCQLSAAKPKSMQILRSTTGKETNQSKWKPNKTIGIYVQENAKYRVEFLFWARWIKDAFPWTNHNTRHFKTR